MVSLVLEQECAGKLGYIGPGDWSVDVPSRSCDGWGKRQKKIQSRRWGIHSPECSCSGESLKTKQRGIVQKHATHAHAIYRPGIAVLEEFPAAVLDVAWGVIRQVVETFEPGRVQWMLLSSGAVNLGAPRASRRCAKGDRRSCV
jgi:hypothetical protein